MEIAKQKDGLEVYGIDCINLDLTLNCGQSFRWKKCDGVWHGVAYGRKIAIEQQNGKLIFYDTDEEAFESIWKTYFDLERDYKSITQKYKSDKFLSEAAEKYYGIRVLNQEPWEALCSFIISQNNNIPRIKGIIERLCQSFGENLGDGSFSFPSAERLSALKAEDLSPLRAGFRAKYIIDAAQRVAGGEIDFGKIEKEDISYGRRELEKICGVGPKVAECCLLYGCKKAEAFPVDVWVKRIMSELYPEGLPECALPEKGIAQQYLFHWRRNLEKD